MPTWVQAQPLPFQLLTLFLPHMLLLTVPRFLAMWPVIGHELCVLLQLLVT